MAVSRFWQDKSLEQMSREEWESLCDGCGRCCLHKLEDEDTDELYFTRVACRNLNESTCRCIDYPNRKTLVPECLVLTPEEPAVFDWLPDTCAYRLLSQGNPLPSWHPLISGTTESVVLAGISVKGKVVSENSVHPDDMEDHVIHWV
ncbi:YcgN family cysteine cluster protein [Teredinibacter purpureus]|uniref:YcgN family cysteine cluster protein n=1 Tax=Teredinibacter purpureus TaxID=2731756 RepID=UPI0005F80B99|nr:YcgN family cysteine cluster protein [Teredinibacter purpureus]